MRFVSRAFRLMTFSDITFTGMTLSRMPLKKFIRIGQRW